LTRSFLQEYSEGMKAAPLTNTGNRGLVFRTLTLVSLALLLIIGTFFVSAWYFSKNKTVIQIQNRQVQNDKVVTKNQQITIDTSNLKVPEPQEVLADQSIASPKSAVEIVPGDSNKLRIFEVLVTNGAFSAQKIIVYENEIVRINFSTKDNTADLSIPEMSLKQTVGSGEVKILEFQAPSHGMYPFVCNSCLTNQGKTNGETETPGGILIVLPKT
jgi:heme/copper-type cytochrome/quinol oxidase subunit 2